MNPDGSMDEADFAKLRREVNRRNEVERKRRENSPANRLHRKLQAIGYRDVQKPERIRSGHWQRSSGAFVWSAQCSGGSVGSQETMSCCIKMTDDELRDELDSYRFQAGRF